MGVTPAQLRRDLASFGSFGNIARGYDVRQMSRTISQIIGTDHIQNVALVGVGDLGRALLSYRGFEERGFHIAAAFDVDPDKVGRVFAGRRCYGLDEARDRARRPATSASSCSPPGPRACRRWSTGPPPPGVAVVPQLRPQDASSAPGGLLRGAHRHLGQVGEALVPEPAGRPVGAMTTCFFLSVL